MWNGSEEHGASTGQSVANDSSRVLFGQTLQMYNLKHSSGMSSGP
jgi:hypothetical protein